MKINEYIKQFNEAFDRVSEKEINKAIKLLSNTHKQSGLVYLIGNGGSSAIASHWANDLNKPKHDVSTGKRVMAMCLSDNTPLLTAIANDIGYDYIYSEQLKNFIDSHHLLIAISSSGNSPNIIEAAVTARAKGMKVIALVGFDGGKLSKISDAVIHVPSNDYGIIESIHHTLIHYLTRQLIK